MTADATDDNAPPGGMGTEIVTHTLPSYNEDDDDAQRLQDQGAAELPFGNDAPPEDEEHRRRSRPSNQTRSLFSFSRRNKMIILGSGIGTILLLCVATGLSSNALVKNNNSMVIESFNVGAPTAAKSTKTKAPTAAKSGKATSCTLNNQSPRLPPEGGDCANCCVCESSEPYQECSEASPVCLCSI